jgi:Putative Flp pilus-assembly TadE/G-like
MPGRRFLRYARRALGVSSRRFARDEHGTVMVLTIAFALPLALFLFGSFNIGVGLLSRMRAQNTADAASYSASLWQARFLNYCAYTRRHIVGNFATIGLCTAYVNSDRMYKNIYDAEELNPTRNQDSDTFYSIKNQMQITRLALMAAIPVVKMIRDGSDTMNGFLSKSQLMLYQAIGTSCEGIMKKVVREASGRQETDFELDTGSSMSSLAR